MGLRIIDWQRLSIRDVTPRSVFSERIVGNSETDPSPFPVRILNQHCRAALASSLEVGIPYAAPNLTDTSFDTPGSCMVTP